MRLAKARVDMWEVFLKKLEVITQASAVKSKDLDTKPAPITNETKQLKDLKTRWDNGAFAANQDMLLRHYRCHEHVAAKNRTQT